MLNDREDYRSGNSGGFDNQKRLSKNGAKGKIMQRRNAIDSPSQMTPRNQEKHVFHMVQITGKI
jgi:hypothetical protein